MFKQIALSVAVSVALPLLFFGFVQLSKRLLPYRPPPGQRQWSLAQLERLFKRCEGAIFLCHFAAGFLFTGLWLAIFAILRAALQPKAGDDGILVAASMIFIGTICVFGGSLANQAVKPVWLAMLLKQRAPLYTVYRKLRYGPLVLAGASLLAILFAVFLAVSAYFMLTTYAFFGPDAIRLNYAFEEAAHYTYRDVTEIRGQPAKGDPARSWYEIEFADGRIWSDGSTLRLYDVCESHKVAAFVASRSGRPIVGPDIFRENGCS